ncbi:MAG: TatD family hydrolase, partial [Candidatus Omnitrophica bacterium]|nr:TatD family hydrolase [Candidatus Omnitrophota bacterium]
MTIIDTHTHIDQLEDISAALSRASQAGVTDIMTLSVDLESIKKTLSIAGQYKEPRIHPCLGIHPGMIHKQEAELAFSFMKEHIHEAVAIGETGLDYWYKWARKDALEQEKQKDFFRFHLKLAHDFDLPVVIHARAAWKDCFEMTITAGIKRALFHWYSGPLDVLERILEAGYYVS